jgi:hypothetical protein
LIVEDKQLKGKIEIKFLIILIQILVICHVFKILQLSTENGAPVLIRYYTFFQAHVLTQIFKSLYFLSIQNYKKKLHLLTRLQLVNFFFIM